MFRFAQHDSALIESSDSRHDQLNQHVTKTELIVAYDGAPFAGWQSNLTKYGAGSSRARF